MHMTIQQFIETAIEGGWPEQWDPKETSRLSMRYVKASDYKFLDWYPEKLYITSIFLDPKAWEAVGKVRGWSEESVYQKHIKMDPESRKDLGDFAEDLADHTRSNYVDHMHAMIDAVCSGKTLEEYIATL